MLQRFPDGEHAAAVILSQSDAAKICFKLCFEAAARGGDGDEYQHRLAVRRMYELLLAGATSGPGEIEPAENEFPGEAGFGARARQQLTDEFGCDPLATADSADGLEFGEDEMEEALRFVFQRSGAVRAEQREALWADGSCGRRRKKEPRTVWSEAQSNIVAVGGEDPDAWISDVYVGKDEL